MKAFANHLACEMRSTLRDGGRLLMYHLFPLSFFVLAGSLMTAVNPYFREAMLPAMVLFAVMSASLLAQPSALVQARENGVFRSFRVNGVPSASILAVPLIATAVHVAAASAVIVVVGVHVFAGRPPSSLAGFAAAWVLSYFAYAAIGVLLGVASDRDSSATVLSQLVFIPSILLGGLMVPVRVFPEHLQRLALLFPSTHCMRAFEGLGGGGEDMPWASLLVLGSSVLVSVGLAQALFEWDSRANRPSRKKFLAVLAIAPYAIAALAGR